MFATIAAALPLSPAKTKAVQKQHEGSIRERLLKARVDAALATLKTK
jgi:hypothetical protein